MGWRGRASLGELLSRFAQSCKLSSNHCQLFRAIVEDDSRRDCRNSLWSEQAGNSPARLIPRYGTMVLLLQRFDETGEGSNVAKHFARRNDLVTAEVDHKKHKAEHKRRNILCVFSSYFNLLCALCVLLCAFCGQPGFLIREFNFCAERPWFQPLILLALDGPYIRPARSSGVDQVASGR